MTWPLPLDTPLGDEYASVRTARGGGKIMLGMAFLARQRGVVFDLTKGRERVGIVPWEPLQGQRKDEYGQKQRDHILQLLVGGIVALGMVGGWRWYQSKEVSKD